MKIKKLHIQNYKSLVDLEIIEPNSFTVFAGPNGAGKSNIFEALEFGSFNIRLQTDDVERLFGGKEKFINFKSSNSDYLIHYEFDNFHVQ